MIIFTMLLVSQDNYFETVIIRYFDVYVSNNFGELVGKNIETIKTIRDVDQLCGDYINTTLVRKLGLYIHSLIPQNILRERK